MSQTLTILDELYNQLESEAYTQGFESIERLLERTHKGTQNGHSDISPQDVFDQIEAFQKRLAATLGIMPDSADLVREDRER